MSDLLILTIGCAGAVVVSIGFGAFVLFHNPKSASSRLFFAVMLSLALSQLVTALGANLSANTLAAHVVWLFELNDVVLGTVFFAFIIVELGVYQKWRRALYAMGGIGALIIGASLSFPQLFIPALEARPYAESYPVDGPLYTVMFIFLSLTLLVASLTVMLIERRSRSDDGKRRIDYYLLSLGIGALFGFIEFAPTFGLSFSPLSSVFLFLFPIPMVYGMITKDVLGVRIVLRQTVVFTAVIALLTSALVALSLLSNYLRMLMPGFAHWWVLPFFAALGGTLAGALYLRTAHEAEALKSEFITVIAHKFRTPLTRIRWSTEALLKKELSPDARALVEDANISDSELIQLSNLLINAARTDKGQYAYVYTDVDLPELLRAVAAGFTRMASEKKLTMTLALPGVLPHVYADRERLASALHVFFENAINYTPEGGKITISAYSLGDSVSVSITDTGIGIAPEDLSRVFKRFYRGSEARRADTEGLGLGLSMAKNIIERQRGSVGVRSGGLGKGSEFWFTLPIRAAMRRAGTPAG